MSVAVHGVEGGGSIQGMHRMSREEWMQALAKQQQVHDAAYAEPTEAMLRAVRRAVLEAKVKWARGAEARWRPRRARRAPRRRLALGGARGAGREAAPRSTGWSSWSARRIGRARVGGQVRTPLAR